jgi:hypothetical protein
MFYWRFNEPMKRTAVQDYYDAVAELFALHFVGEPAFLINGSTAILRNGDQEPKTHESTLWHLLGAKRMRCHPRKTHRLPCRDPYQI